MEKRCWWAEAGNDLMKEYHDKEWGKPVHDDRMLFEFIVLEGAQAGLSWQTVLNKRVAYKKAFDNFDVKKVAKYDEKKVKELMNNAGIIRNQLKIKSTIINAKAFIKIQEEFGSFDKYMWQFTNGKPIVNSVKGPKEVPVKTPISDAMSKDLIKRGFKFVGSTIIYAHMQATGMVNDHLNTCPAKK
jgi:DNA-3-methyladenine glycosylase I